MLLRGKPYFVKRHDRAVQKSMIVSLRPCPLLNRARSRFTIRMLSFLTRINIFKKGLLEIIFRVVKLNYVLKNTYNKKILIEKSSLIVMKFITLKF